MMGGEVAPGHLTKMIRDLSVRMGQIRVSERRTQVDGGRTVHGQILVLFLVCFDTQSLLAQAGLKLTMWPRMTLNF